MEFREINNKELKLLRKLNREFKIDFDVIFNSKKILISERREVFILDKNTGKIAEKIKKDPYSAGLYIGKIKKWKIDLGIEGAALISSHSKNRVTVNSRKEQVILYGGDIFSKSTINGESPSTMDRCLIVNKREESIAIGTIKKEKILNLRDRGYYLRSRRQWF